MTSALYLHVPFCARKCAYCDFASWATPSGDPLMGAYERALEAQLDEVASLGLLEGCETAYVGGGTPTLLGEKDLGSLVEKIMGVARPSELTCEANPDSLTDEVLAAVRAAGATRLAVGVLEFLDLGEEQLRGLVGRGRGIGLDIDGVVGIFIIHGDGRQAARGGSSRRGGLAACGQAR